MKDEKTKEIEQKIKIQQEKEAYAEEEMLKLAIEMSMRDFEEEEKNRPKNALDAALKADGAKSKYSKVGFVPKNKAAKPDTEKHQENVSQNQGYNEEYYDEYYQDGSYTQSYGYNQNYYHKRYSLNKNLKVLTISVNIEDVEEREEDMDRTIEVEDAPEDTIKYSKSCYLICI